MKKVDPNKGVVGFVARVGHKIPNTFALFCGIFCFVAVLSWLGKSLGWQATYTAQGKVVTKQVQSFFTANGIRWIFKNAIPNYLAFDAFGIVVITTIAVGLLEETGYFSALVKKQRDRISLRWLPHMVAFVGIMSSFTADTGYIIWPPLAAIIYKSLGKHPVAGAIVAFASVTVGFTANLLIGIVDVIMVKVAMTATGGSANPSVGQNYYFMALATIVLTFVIAWASKVITEPMAAKIKISDENYQIDDKLKLAKEETDGLKKARWGYLLTVFIVGLLGSPISPLRQKPDGTVIPLNESPFIFNVTLQIVIGAVIVGIFYGLGAKKIKNSNDVFKMMSNAVIRITPMFVLFFVAANFIKLFQWTNLDVLISVKGAQLLLLLNFGGRVGNFFLLIAFFVLTTTINLFMSGLTSKWTIMAPIFLPMFQQLNIPSDYILLMYRIADSVTNNLAPTNKYLTVILVTLIVSHVHKSEKFGFGDVIAFMFPLSVVVSLTYLAMFALFYWTGLPLGF